MVRILFCLMLSLAFSVGAFAAEDKLTKNQLNAIVAEANKAKNGVGHIELMIDHKRVTYTVTKDALGNITATGSAEADIQTIAIATGSNGSSASVPLAVTIIARDGAISSFNVSSTNGDITSVTSTSDTISKVKTGPNLTTTTVSQTSSTGETFTDTFTSFGGAGGGTVSVTYAPGTSPTTLTSVSPH